MIEPDDSNAREYARLLVRAEKVGLNIDGQALLTWEEINGAAFTIMNQTKHATR